jgi:hypothetical protein
MDGFTVNLNRLFGEKSDAPGKCFGKEIAEITVDDHVLKITFTDGLVLSLWDDGQSCCEARYMDTDDDLAAFVGATFTDLRVEEGPDDRGEYGDSHEQQFLLVDTSKGTFTVVTHNEHNGYYGGFSITADLCHE